MKVTGLTLAAMLLVTVSLVADGQYLLDDKSKQTFADVQTANVESHHGHGAANGTRFYDRLMTVVGPLRQFDIRAAVAGVLKRVTSFFVPTTSVDGHGRQVEGKKIDPDDDFTSAKIRTPNVSPKTMNYANEFDRKALSEKLNKFMMKKKNDFQEIEKSETKHKKIIEMIKQNDKNDKPIGTQKEKKDTNNHKEKNEIEITHIEDFFTNKGLKIREKDLKETNGGMPRAKENLTTEATISEQKIKVNEKVIPAEDIKSSQVESNVNSNVDERKTFSTANDINSYQMERKQNAKERKTPSIESSIVDNDLKQRDEDDETSYALWRIWLGQNTFLTDRTVWISWIYYGILVGYMTLAVIGSISPLLHIKGYNSKTKENIETEKTKHHEQMMRIQQTMQSMFNQRDSMLQQNLKNGNAMPSIFAQNEPVSSYVSYEKSNLANGYPDSQLQKRSLVTIPQYQKPIRTKNKNKTPNT